MIRIATALFVIGFNLACAASAPPSEASIREVLRVTEAQKLIDGMMTQVDGMLKGALPKALGRALTEDEQRLADSMNAKMMGLLREELSWDKMEALYFQVYQKAFTQEEIDGMLEFYRTPAGIALIKKMPLVMQETMSVMQARMGPMTQRLQAAIQDTLDEIRVAKRK